MKNQTSQKFHRKCTKCRPLKNSTLRKYRWKTELFKGFIVNVSSGDLWKIPHLENIDERPNSSRVSSKMYLVWTSEKFHTQKISMKDQTSQRFHQRCTKCGSLKNFHTWKISMKVQTPPEFHRECTECGLLRNFTISNYRYKIQLLKSFIEIY